MTIKTKEIQAELKLKVTNMEKGWNKNTLKGKKIL
jgi:hypothetical protein